jgi:hypothetical protein
VKRRKLCRFWTDLETFEHLRAAIYDSSESMDSYLFGDHILNLHDYTTTITSTISDFFSNAPRTSQLYAPSEVQRPDDFDSTVTTGSTKNDSATPPTYKDVD